MQVCPNLQSKIRTQRMSRRCKRTTHTSNGQSPSTLRLQNAATDTNIKLPWRSVSPHCAGERPHADVVKEGVHIAWPTSCKGHLSKFMRHFSAGQAPSPGPTLSYVYKKGAKARVGTIRPSTRSQKLTSFAETSG